MLQKIVTKCIFFFSYFPFHKNIKCIYFFIAISEQNKKNLIFSMEILLQTSRGMQIEHFFPLHIFKNAIKII